MKWAPVKQPSAKGAAHGLELVADLDAMFGTVLLVGLGISLAPSTRAPASPANKAPLGTSDLIVIDSGADFGGYTADVTRTIPASGRFTTRNSY